MGFLEHSLDIGELEEDHEFDFDEGFISGADAADIEIHLVRDDAKFFKLESAGDFHSLAIITMPAELMESFGRSGDVDGGAAEDAVGDFSRGLIVDDDGLVGVELDGLLWNNGLVEERVKPDGAGAGLVLGVAIAEGDNEIFSFRDIDAVEWFDPREGGEYGGGAGDEVTGSVCVPADHRLAVLNCGRKDHGSKNVRGWS